MYRLAFLLLTLSCIPASADHYGDGPNLCHIFYPNIPGEVLLENDKLVVQRFTIEPGEWESIHRHLQLLCGPGYAPRSPSDVT